MRDSQDKKRLGTYRKRRTIVSTTSEKSIAALSSNEPEVALYPENLNEFWQCEVYSPDLGHEIAHIVLDSPNAEIVLPEISKALQETFQVEYCLIAAMVNDGTLVQNAYWYPDRDQSSSLGNPSHLLGHLHQAALLSISDPFAIADVTAVESPLSELSGSTEFPVRAILAIETRFQGRVNGIVALMRSAVHHWTASEKRQLQALSDSIAMAISQVQLQRQVKASSGYQAFLNQLTMAIRSSTELEQVLKLALDGTARNLQVDRGLILLLKYTDPLQKKGNYQKAIPEAKATVVSEWLSVAASPENENQKSWLNQSFWLSECQLCQEGFTNAPNQIVIADKSYFTSNNIDDGIASVFDLTTMSALVLVPLESQGTVLGFLGLQQRQPRSWVREELELVELVSAQLSIAILQFQTLRQTSALVEERTAQLQSILRVQAKLYETTRQHVEQLRHLNQVKDEFIDTMSDRLRNPLASMRMAIRMLRQPGISAERQTKYLDILEQQCTQEINLINDILALQQLESKKSTLHLQKIDLKQVIEALAASFSHKWGVKGVDLAMDLPKRSLMIQSDPDSLDRILEELLTNAGKYSDPDTTVHLAADYHVEGTIPQIVLTFSNTGPGISPAEQNYIFEKFRRGQGVSEQLIQGTGLGLALVKCLVQHLNGTIAVSSNPINDSDSWLTCFTVILPQMQG
ncbi:MAG TPA: GAF domain-containing sensor histidine kinase [Leptolyngbyaceae cyanobacterium]